MLPLTKPDSTTSDQVGLLSSRLKQQGTYGFARMQDSPAFTQSVNMQERKRSFGVGGAGNIRTKTEATVVDFLPHSERRRSSVWSMSGTQSLSSSPSNSKMTKVIEGVKVFFSSGSKEEKEDGSETGKSP